VGGASTDTEEARAFFERRLGIYAGWVFLLSFGFFLVNQGIAASVDPTMVLQRWSWWHLAASAVAGGIWVVARRGSLSLSRLRVIDAAGTITASLFFSLMGAAIVQQQFKEAPDWHPESRGFSSAYSPAPTRSSSERWRYPARRGGARGSARRPWRRSWSCPALAAPACIWRTPR